MSIVSDAQSLPPLSKTAVTKVVFHDPRPFAIFVYSTGAAGRVMAPSSRQMAQPHSNTKPLTASQTCAVAKLHSEKAPWADPALNSIDKQAIAMAHR
jgi:hypothetical protein